MSKKLILWKILFVLGLFAIVFRLDISRFTSDVTALLTGGIVLSVVSGAGILLETYFTKTKSVTSDDEKADR